MKKAALEISFSWLFALIVGAFILFLAIYAVTKFTETEQTISSAKTSKELGILLNPLEISVETGKTIPLAVPLETRIYNRCNNNFDDYEFGQQIIQTEEKSFNKWVITDIDARFENKYIFSERFVEGRNFYLFSKPFKFPFKVTDLIYLTSAQENYCFVESPEAIEQELLDLGQANLFIENCPENSISICFNNNNCDIKVNYLLGYVEKNNERMHFETDALMYAAIFASSEIYECQLQRVMQRLKNLALLYNGKAGFIARQGCSSELYPYLTSLKTFANTYEDSEDLSRMIGVVDDIERKNDFADCKLW